jgi:dUTP pyrophosphatase
LLKVKRLSPDAILPTVGHQGEDLGFDLYALEDTVLLHGVATAVRTGISAKFGPIQAEPTTNFVGFPVFSRRRVFGLLIKDRSSMAARGIKTSAGVIDAGYTGELKVMMTSAVEYEIEAGQKIAQMIPQEVFTGGGVAEVFELPDSSRGEGGFGSTGV